MNEHPQQPIWVVGPSEEDIPDESWPRLRFESLWEDMRDLGLRIALQDWRSEKLFHAERWLRRRLIRVATRDQPITDTGLDEIFAVWLLVKLPAIFRWAYRVWVTSDAINNGYLHMFRPGDDDPPRP